MSKEGLRRDYGRLADAILDLLLPTYILDVGCGDGKLLAELSHRTVTPMRGADPNKRVGDLVNEARPYFLASYRVENMTWNILVDTVCCIEVAEHLPETDADLFVSSLASIADRWLVFSAAQPGQGGAEHLNEQKPEYWSERICAQGFQRRDWETRQFQLMLKKCQVARWLPKNIQVFRRAGR